MECVSKAKTVQQASTNSMALVTKSAKCPTTTANKEHANPAQLTVRNVMMAPVVLPVKIAPSPMKIYATKAVLMEPISHLKQHVQSAECTVNLAILPPTVRLVRTATTYLKVHAILNAPWDTIRVTENV